MRGATSICRISLPSEIFQSTRPVRGATSSSLVSVSIHIFQSTRPVRGATTWHTVFSRFCNISIHAPRAGRDQASQEPLSYHRHFNPRAPCGARRTSCGHPYFSLLFQSTRPVRGATICRALALRWNRISIHAPRAGRDGGLRQNDGGGRGFQSTRPVRGATIAKNYAGLQEIFQSTRPVRGATITLLSPPPSMVHFNPRAPCGARLSELLQFIILINFNPRAPCGARRMTFFSVSAQSLVFQSTRPVRGATLMVR